MSDEKTIWPDGQGLQKRLLQLEVWQGLKVIVLFCLEFLCLQFGFSKWQFHSPPNVSRLQNFRACSELPKKDALGKCSVKYAGIWLLNGIDKPFCNKLKIPLEVTM